jgi:WD40 repeat protein
LLEFEKNKLLCGTSDNVINLWDLNAISDKCVCSYIGHTLWINCLVKINNNYFASASNDTKIKIWDYYNRKCIKTLDGHVDCILSLIILQNNNYLCSGSADLSIRIWDWENNNCISILKGHEKWVKCILELHNGIIVSGSDDKTIKLWKDYELFKTIEDHTNSVRTFCQINNNYFASGSFDCTIKIWDINTWACVQTLIGHDSNIICVISLNQSNKYNNNQNMKRPALIASCSNDKSIKIWEESN